MLLDWYWGYKYLFSLSSDHLFLNVHLLQLPSRRVFLFFRVFEDVFLLTYQIKFLGAKPWLLMRGKSTLFFDFTKR